MNLIKNTVWWVLVEMIVAGVGLLVYMGAYILYDKNYSQSALDAYYHDMYNKIGAASGQRYPGLLISDGLEVNAYANESNVIITRGMINYVQNEDELALVMGHEIGHYILKHVFQSSPDELSPVDAMFWSVQREENSDKIGAFLALQSGFDVCRGREIGKRLHESGDAIENASHPTAIFRYVNLRLPQCGEDL